MLLMKVKGIGIDNYDRPIVILKNNDMILPIWIGHNEASAIGLALEHQKLQRPLTHNLIQMILQGFKIELLKTEIYKLEDNTFFARLILKQTHEDKETNIVDIDCRPSDAIAISLQMNTDIFCAEEILLNAGQYDDIQN